MPGSNLSRYLSLHDMMGKIVLLVLRKRILVLNVLLVVGDYRIDNNADDAF